MNQIITRISLIAAGLCAAALNLHSAEFSDLGFAAASKQAAQSGRIVLVDFYTTWCGPCKMLDSNTWTDATVAKLLEQKTVALRVDAEKDTNLAQRYKIQAYPTVLLAKPDGTEIDRLVGYREPRQFIEDFNASLSGKDSVTRARDQLAAAGTNDPTARLKVGMALAQKGDDAAALAEYLWCFDHGAEVSPAFVGVRGSFLVMYIKNLAAHYPPARQALETRRDQAQAGATADSTNLTTFVDLISLNKALEQEDKNLAAYDRLPVGSKARGAVAQLLVEQFLKTGRYADVLQGADGLAGFQQKLDRLNSVVNTIANDNPLRAQMESSLRQVVLSDGAHSFEALAGLKRTQDAQNLADRILKYDSTQATRTLLAEAAQRAKNSALEKYVGH